MICDCFPFFNELDLLEIRFEELYDVVDKFVLIEGNKSFRGIPKSYVFYENRDRFLKYKDKITYLRYTMPEGQLSLIDEWNYKNALMHGLQRCNDDDIIMFNDVDEIPRQKDLIAAIELFKTNKYQTITFQMDWYNYFLNGRMFNLKTNEEETCWGTIMFNYAFLKNLPHLVKIRNSRGTEDETHLQMKHSGWHFTFVGDPKHIQEKITNWTHWSEYIGRNSIEFIMDRINKNMILNDHPYQIKMVPVDESYPIAIRNNFDKYKHLVKIN